jgi:hypothetical protein
VNLSAPERTGEKGCGRPGGNATRGRRSPPLINPPPPKQYYIPVITNVCNYAFSNGYTSLLWPGLLYSFNTAYIDNSVSSYAVATANAIADGGYPTAYTYGQAIQNAEYGSDNWRALVAATASLFCTSADSASAWGAAIAVAVEVDDGPNNGNVQQSNGCRLLADAYAQAVQQCGQGLFTILDGVDQTTVRVLQTCGLIDGAVPQSYGGGAGRR